MLFTIGYTTFQSDDFIDVLKKYEINVVIDVRSLPYSKHHTQYDKEIIEHILTINKIYYRNYSSEFGACQTDQQYFAQEGYLDFELFTKSKRFKQGLDKINNSLTRGFNIVLMCAEKDPATCHRSIMISRVFHNNGEAVNHIIADGKIESQNDIELRLLDKHCPDRNQPNLFGEQPIEQLIAWAYKKQNAEIGYRIVGNDNNGEIENHILVDDKIENQDDIELRLLDKNFPDRNQLTLFGEQTIEELTSMAYRNQSAEVGYRIGGNE